MAPRTSTRANRARGSQRITVVHRPNTARAAAPGPPRRARQPTGKSPMPWSEEDKALLWVYKKVYPKQYTYSKLEFHSFDRSNQAMRLVFMKMDADWRKLPSAALIRSARQYVKRERLGDFSPASKALREALLDYDAGCVASANVEMDQAAVAAYSSPSPAPAAEQPTAEVEVASPVDAADQEKEHGVCAACEDEAMSDALLSAVEDAAAENDDDDATISAPSSPAPAAADPAHAAMRRSVDALLAAAEIQRARDSPAPATPISSSSTVSRADIQRIQAGIEAEKRAAFRAEQREDEQRAAYLRAYYDDKGAPYPAWIQARMAIRRLVVPDAEQEDLDRRREEAERNRRLRYGPARDE